MVKRAAGSTGAGTTVQFVYDTQGKPFMLRLIKWKDGLLLSV